MIIVVCWQRLGFEAHEKVKGHSMPNHVTDLSTGLHHPSQNSPQTTSTKSRPEKTALNHSLSRGDRGEEKRRQGKTQKCFRRMAFPDKPTAHLLGSNGSRLTSDWSVQPDEARPSPALMDERTQDLYTPWHTRRRPGHTS